MEHTSILDSVIARRAIEFPATTTRAFFAHAAVSPLPKRVVDAVAAYCERVSGQGQFAHLHAAEETACRRLAAQLLGVMPSEIALVSSTSAGLNLVASGLDWRPGQEVIFPHDDFLSNSLPWFALRRRGVVPIAIPRNEQGVITAESILRCLTPRSRLVAASSVDFVTGVPIDIDSLGGELRRRGVLLCIDGIQSLGAVPTSAANADFLVADAHKWMLGPQGIAVLYVRRALLDELRPPQVGWKSVDGGYRDSGAPFWDDARRYEPGSLNAIGAVGFAAALTLIASIGVSAISTRVGELRQELATMTAACGYDPIAPDLPCGTSPFLSFRRRSDSLSELYRRLDDSKVIVSLRRDHRGQDVVRLAPHFYTNDEDVARLKRVLVASGEMQ